MSTTMKTAHQILQFKSAIYENFEKYKTLRSQNSSICYDSSNIAVVANK